MGKPRTATSKSGAATSRESSSPSAEQRFSSSSDLWPEVAPEESSRRAVHRKKSLSTSRDQLLYLQALFPYAPYDELMAIINTTDGPDEAAQHAYEALNPNYTGYLYLKEQADLLNSTKATKAQRATAFSGLKEALEERAADTFRPGMYGNLSQLQEYHETVGLFALDTTEWDRAMLLPARDLAEMAFMDLPLREEPSSPSSSDRGVDECGANGSGGGGGGGGTNTRPARGSHPRARPQLLSLAMNGSNARFMDSSFVKPHGYSFDTALLSSPQAPASSTAAAALERRDYKPRDGCKTPMASPDAHESAQQQQQQQQAEEPEDTGVLYLQDSDPEYKAPIMAWAPQAIRVGPAEAMRQQEGALRVFDEATFFTDPLLARKPSSILLQTPDTKPALPPANARPTPATAGPQRVTATQGSVSRGLEGLLSVSPSPSPRARRERHEPVDSASESLPQIADEEEGSACDEEHTHRLQFMEEEVEEYDAAAPLRERRHRQGSSEAAHSIVIEVDNDEEEGDTVSASNPAIENSRSGHTDDSRTATAAGRQPDFSLQSHSDASAHLAMQGSLRETAVETLKARKRRPLTSSEKVKQRMRKLKPVGNVVFRENADVSPAVTPGDHGSHTFANEERPTTATSHSTRLPVSTGTAMENTLRTEDDVYTEPSAGTQQPAEWTTRDSRLTNDDGPQPPLPGNGAHVFGSAAAAAATERRPTISTTIPTSPGVEGDADANLTTPSAAAADGRARVCGQAVSIPAAHAGCSSLDPAAYLNSEEERWSCIVEMLKPFEDVFGAKFRCELVRCVYDDCKAIRARLTDILQRLLHVVGQAVEGKTIADGLAEEPMDLPFFGAILLSTSPVKLQELAFHEDKCQLVFCEEGTRLRVKLNVKKLKLEPIQFAYIDEADAARQNRAAQQSRLKTPQPRSRAAAWTLRHHAVEKYQTGITRGTATVSAARVKLKGIVYIWLMASGKMHITFQEAKVSIGSFAVSTDVPKLNVLFTLGAPIIKMFVERMLLEGVKGVHTI